MNGEEVEGRPRYSPAKPSRLLSGRVEELTDGEKIDLLMFAQTDIAQTLFKLMEIEIINARDEAMACDPSMIPQQKALMDRAHAMANFYTNIREKITTAINEHLAVAQKAEAEEALEDKEFLEAVILANSTGQPLPERKPKIPVI